MMLEIIIIILICVFAAKFIDDKNILGEDEPKENSLCGLEKRVSRLESKCQCCAHQNRDLTDKE